MENNHGIASLGTTCMVDFVKDNPLAVIPEYKSHGAAGMDLSSVENKQVLPGQVCVVDTGLLIELARGYEAQIRPRSGLAAKNGITVLNTPGTIDSDYRGLVKVILINHGKEPFDIQIGDRIAQLVIAKVERAFVCEAKKEFMSSTNRGPNGFGSTGVN
jgi:dUTP pyrophosphatase